MQIDSVGQIALPVADPDRSQAFYGELLGLPLLYRFGNLVFFSTGNLRLMLSATESPKSASGIVYFNVADLEAAYGEFTARGVAFDDTPHLIARMPDHELWMTFFKDPDGHQLALMSEKRG